RVVCVLSPSSRYFAPSRSCKPLSRNTSTYAYALLWHLLVLRTARAVVTLTCNATHNPTHISSAVGVPFQASGVQYERRRSVRVATRPCMLGAAWRSTKHSKGHYS
ncbi:unnamed protein product, partial [Laminaria digitata]